MCVCLCFSLTGDLPFVRSGRQGSVCVCLCLSLTGDLPFVRSGRQGSVCVLVFVPDRRSAFCAVW